MSGVGFIYSLHDPLTGSLRYVGKTMLAKPSKRLWSHLRYARRSSSNIHLVAWLRSLIRQDLVPDLLVWERDVPAAELPAREVHWIAYFRAAGHRLANATDGGEGAPGRVFSEETRAKMRAAAANRGPEFGAKISAALRGRKRSPEAVAKTAQGMRRAMEERRVTNPEWFERHAQKGRATWTPERHAAASATRTGKKLSAEHSAAISAGLKGRQFSPETRAKMSEGQRRRAAREREEKS